MYHNKIPIYPVFYLLKGDYRSFSLQADKFHWAGTAQVESLAGSRYSFLIWKKHVVLAIFLRGPKKLHMKLSNISCRLSLNLIKPYTFG